MMAKTFQYFSEAEFYTSLFYFSTYIFLDQRMSNQSPAMNPKREKSTFSSLTMTTMGGLDEINTPRPHTRPASGREGRQPSGVQESGSREGTHNI